MTIRQARIEDIPEMVSIGEAVIANSDALADLPRDREAMTSYVEAFVSREEMAAMVFEMNGAIVGFILAMVTPSALGGGEIIGRKASWIVRHPGHGAPLLRAAEAWAASKGATAFFASLPDPKPRPVMERFGYEAIETVYRKQFGKAEQEKTAA